MVMSGKSEVIEIENNLVRVVTKSLQYEIALKDFLPELQTYKPVTLPTMAHSQVFAHWDQTNPSDKKLYILAELAPGVRNIRKLDRRYKLAMPWTYFWFVATTGRSVEENSWSMEQYYCYHAREQYAGLNSQFMVALLPNLYRDGRVCWGTTGSSAANLANRVDDLVSNWYVSTFNSDLDGIPLPYGEHNYRRWVEETRSNPLCWQNWPEWTNSNITKITVKQLLENNGVVPETLNIDFPEFIPPVDGNLTFGRWEEWFMRLNPEQRGRAFGALTNLRIDNPEQVPNIPDPDLSDDGGVPIDTSIEVPLRRR